MKYISFLLLFILMACQTSPVKSFDQIQMGMDKNQVLHLVGSPSTSMRFSGKDRWIYRLYEADTRYIREVHFLDDKAVYIGDEYKPEPNKDAAFIDQQNSVKEAEIAELEVQKKQNLESSYNDYQKKAKLNDKIQYMPSFEKIK